MARSAVALLALSLLTAACGGSGDSAAPESPTTAAVTEAPVDTAVEEAADSWMFEGADGVVSTISDTSRIVALSGDLTEGVFALGFGDSVVAVDVTTVEPETARRLPIIGVGRFLNAEAVLAQAPTLVIGDTQTSPLPAIEQIRSAGVPVVILDVPTTFDGLYAKLVALGKLLGDEAAGQSLADQVAAEVDAAVAAVDTPAPSPGIAFIYSRGPDVMLLFGEGMTTVPLIESVGGRDVGAASGVSGTVAVTPEALIAAAPDIIITTSEGLAALGGVDGFLATPGVAETPAGRDRRILDYPEGDFLTFGPRVAASIALLASDMATALSAP
ncbi:MAG TPA: ABC transporter substrate-binding protein [Acidimicrobiia bacterium]|jgi:iron complex transport system substrate-binding protein|nr:ABC transporter substrate-binding protein [Acidimicrobiia bacterium]